MTQIGIKATGTVRKNRKNLPNNFDKDIQNKGESKFYKAGAMLAVSWKDKKTVRVITTDGTTEIIAGEKKKPRIIEKYS